MSRTASGSDFWVACTAPTCDGTYRGSKGRRCMPALRPGAPALCGKCAKAAKVKRIGADVAFGGTDGQAGRKGTDAAMLAKVASGQHKGLHTAGGKLAGGTTAKVAEAITAKLPKVAPKVTAKAPAAKAPAKVKRQRPVRKTA